MCPICRCCKWLVSQKRGRAVNFSLPEWAENVTSVGSFNICTISVPNELLTPPRVRDSAPSLPFQKGLHQRKEWHRWALHGNEATVNDSIVASDSVNVASGNSCDSSSVGIDSIGFNVHAPVFQPHVFTDSVLRYFRPNKGFCPDLIRMATSSLSSIHLAWRVFALALRTAQMPSWCSLSWMASRMACNLGHWRAWWIVIQANAGMATQSGAGKQSYG